MVKITIFSKNVIKLKTTGISQTTKYILFSLHVVSFKQMTNRL